MQVRVHARVRARVHAHVHARVDRCARSRSGFDLDLGSISRRTCGWVDSARFARSASRLVGVRARVRARARVRVRARARVRFARSASRLDDDDVSAR